MNITQPQWPALHRSALLAFVVAALVTVAAFARSAGEQAPQAHATPAGIGNIKTFLEQCPTSDPLYAQFRSDFEIRREGVVVGAIGCTEPISAMPNSQYTDELIALQAVRTIYYMEGGRGVQYPWAPGSMYDWMKSKIGGIDIRGGSYCCTSFNNEWYIAINAQSSFDRDSAREWRGISNRISLIGHEVRHVDGFPHVGGCPLFPTQSFGCDQTYDEANLAPYGIQWWLNSQWLSGGLNVGFACLEWNEVDTIATSHMNRANNDYGKRFVDQSPPVLEMPSQPGGACPGGSVTPGPTATAQPTPTATSSPTSTPQVTPMPPPTPTSTATPAATPTATVTPQVTPTPAPTATPTPVPTAPPALIQGDVDCSRLVTAVDGLMLMRGVAQLYVSQTEPCPEVGEGETHLWGDLDCSGAVNSTDALKLLRYLAGLSVPQNEPCSDIGTLLP